MVKGAPGNLRLVVLAGAHASGKSTAAMYLASFGYLPHLEMGWAYRQALLYSNHESNTLTGPNLAWFDTTVLALERRRDEFIRGVSEVPHCIETWHLGNLAYASLRSPQLVPEFERALVAGVRMFNPLCLLLSISEATFKSRCTLPDLPAGELYGFYSRVNHALLEFAAKHKLDPVLVENDSGIGEFRSALRAALGLLVTDPTLRKAGA